ncbi:ultraviolet-B receptor UVR8-like isoform X1 [Cucurbita maxima]|uniref:Ultraviolet-B receptor UVR8-like isoform X1 n=1 Tax=Cucurbita maxima TaxID=3661 RepID=A0A6J1ITK7_CUCMA|nr:ultraviolet-B receptor UVR8-like isoform X1 [Cucurbita maxima]XP_022981291.1 ultraviolet-B receptor UVR8-like isoform X1 [Cucurbita maxima]XP_022981292.1 ultraviolet-B receptor UVR8-like isoform X1 [Cucurbita maxima]XP_022981293.1 ultraviolet-B receptor UVR8-like isoform X1 [Cucurbita maxima]
MAKWLHSTSFADLPSHLIFEVLTSGRLSARDLVCLELTCKMFGGSHELYPLKFRSLVDFAAFQLCISHSIYSRMGMDSQKQLFDRCQGKWKRVFRFLQLVEKSSNIVETSEGNQMQIATGRYHTLLISKASVYSCGSSLCGVLGHGAETTQCVSFTRINFPPSVYVEQVSASHNHAAFVTQSGEVFTCGDNSSFCCGHRDTSFQIFRPRLVEGLNGIPCKQVSVGHNFSAFLTRKGHVYTCGTNTYGQLGHGDTLEKSTPKVVERLVEIGSVIQISAGPSYVLAVVNDGRLYSFGSGSNFCLGHGEQHNEFQPRVLQTFRLKDIHIVSVSAGDEHAVALDSNGFVYTWGKGYCGALGHGDEIDKTIPQPLNSLKNHLAVQVCARKRKTFVLIDTGIVYGFGWMGFGSLGFPDRGVSDKVLSPRSLNCLRAHCVSQISTGLYHTVVVTDKGKLFGFGDNERAQLGLESLRGCLEPTEILVQDLDDESAASESG